MVGPAPEHTCHFHWDIHHPLVPWHKLNTIFYDGSPTVTQWKVTLQPLRRALNYCAFEIRLEFDRSFDERDEIVANRIELTIFINDSDFDGADVPLFRFNPGNLFSYSFQTEVNGLNVDLLCVTITLHLPGVATVNQYDNEYYGYDIRNLSYDMDRLFRMPSFSDMRLRSPDGTIKNVHTCIIRLRWSNFYRVNLPDAGTVDAAESNISSELLWDILMYLYSGRVYPSIQPPPYFTELFHVIHRYKLYHLYKALVNNDLNPKQAIGRNVVTESHIFPLTPVLASPINARSQTWGLNPNTAFESVFEMKVEIHNGPWLSYSLKSRSLILFYVQVNLDIGKKVEERGGRETTHRLVHQRDYTILPSADVKSGAVLFIGCPEIFGDTSPVDRHGRSRQVEYFVRCTLKFSDGRTFHQLRSSNNELRDNLESMNLLGDHLFQLRDTANDADLQILPCSGNGNKPRPEYIHKAIFAARVPQWREVFLNIEPTDEMPDVATVKLNSEALPYALDYIYTSRATPYPYYLHEQLRDFAIDGVCSPLRNWVFRVYYDWSGSDY